MVAIQGDFSLSGIALALALFRHRCIVAFLSHTARERDGLLASARASRLADLRDHAEPAIEARDPAGPPHPLLEGLRAEGKAGFIIFSSGSSGAPTEPLRSVG